VSSRSWANADGIGFAFAKMILTVISILLGLAKRDCFLAGQFAEESFEVGTVLTSGFDTDHEVN
jgi:hypothetical protein